MMFVLVALIAFLVIAGGFSKDEADCARGSRWYRTFSSPLWFGKRSRSQCYGCCQHHDGPATLFIAWYGDRSLHALPE